jgi:hypothetical protein
MKSLLNKIKQVYNSITTSNSSTLTTNGNTVMTISSSGNVAIGANAGYYETGSSKLFIDNDPRVDEADGRAKALVYGIFAATVVILAVVPPIVPIDIPFKIAPPSSAQVAVGKIDKTTQANPSDFYYQYVFEDGEATYFIDSNGYFVKRENLVKSLTSIASDDFSTF